MVVLKFLPSPAINSKEYFPEGNWLNSNDDFLRGVISLKTNTYPEDLSLSTDWKPVQLIPEGSSPIGIFDRYAIPSNIFYRFLLVPLY